MSEIYQGIILDWQNENVDLRGHSSSISVRNFGNDIEDEAVSALLKVAGKNQKVFQRFFKMKAKKLGLDKLRRYDLYAPIEKPEKKISYNEGSDLIFDTFKEFNTD